MSEVNTANVIIMGREFKIACPPENSEALQHTAAFLNQRMLEVKESGKIAGADRIAIMVALNIAHDFLNTQINGGLNIGEARHKLQSMAQLIDTVVSEQQQSLFEYE